MNKPLIFFAGLAVITLSCSPHALANPGLENSSTWNPAGRVNSVPTSPANPDTLPEPGIRSHISPDIQSSVSGFQNQPFRATPAANQEYIPLAPANAVTSANQSAIPIPSNLGLQFDLSNSATSKPTIKPTVKPVVPAASPSFSTPVPVPVNPAPLPQPSPAAPLPTTSAPKPTDFTLGDLFAGGSDSLVAIVVGNAEGTRSPDGQPNQHFYGHTDPGNGVWNLGTFSYQHGATSPEAADVKQLKRLKQQAQVMQQKATASGLKLTLAEALNGIDLANQAPKAVIDGEGYVDWLVKAHRMGKSGLDAILWARVQSFIDPKTQRWDAPGLGNTVESITHDQYRRMQAIERAITAQNYQIASDARLRSQPIGFQLPRWNFASRMLQKVATLLHE